MTKFVFDREKLKFQEHKRSPKEILLTILKYFLLSIVVAFLFYVVIALLIDTERERKLKAENRYLEQEYAKMEEKMDMLDNAISNLELRDQAIYQDIFNAMPPDYLPEETVTDYGQLDTIKDKALVLSTFDKSCELVEVSKNISKDIDDIITLFSDMGDSVKRIPSLIPVNNFNSAQTGASLGMKVNPFYKTIKMHTGIDLLVPVGTEVIATATGIVEKVTRSKKDKGNSILINHGNGYKTMYAHLNDILVRQGQSVRQGVRIGRSGNTGVSFAPHLHYEVIKDSISQDPIPYFFGSLTTSEYREMMIIASNTGQSLD